MEDFWPRSPEADLAADTRGGHTESELFDFET